MNTATYYTLSHEWIRFMGPDAYVGISHIRLAGARKVKKITYRKIFGFKARGEILAIIQLDCRRIEVHMPVDGSVVSIHNDDRVANQNALLGDTQNKVWLAKIRLRESSSHKTLLSYEQYISNKPAGTRLATIH